MSKSKALLIGDKCLLMQPELIKAVGKSSALLLQQIHFWINNPKVEGKSFEGKKWIANTYESWAADLKVLSLSTVKRAVSNLKRLGILSVDKLSSYKSNRTNWYTINYDRIEEFFPPVSSLTIPEVPSSIAEEIKEGRLILTPSSAQNEPMYIDKKTNKDILINQNNSDELGKDNLKENPAIKPTALEMVAIWNEIITPQVEAQPTRERCQHLIAALKFKFDNNLQKWKEYCLKIASSDFLMGKFRNGFKIALDSALRFSFIQKIFEKQLGIKDLEPNLDLSNDALNSIKLSTEDCRVKDIRTLILKRAGAATYTAWFREIEIELASKLLVIKAANQFKRDWIISKYLPDLQKWLGVQIEICVRT
ncbi:DnaA N-terminal domain-containing protein [Candidatus Odyssella thessalonicensis]|uniref:DnaA N-terminal domain-containing protein n=1 Tax=Candidatus Odyssella thessalonicensis TaxID=84647 RepID=UPI000225B779|nr:DnaA N-terminal domain-containing protein [Candidatus Odyssella thessalonicensis]